MNQADHYLEILNKLIEHQKMLGESMDKQFKETDRRFKDTERRFKDTERRFKDTESRFKDTERIIKETGVQIKESSLKTDKYLGKVKEFDRNWGKLVESLVAPGMVEQFKKINVDIDGMTQRVLKRKQGKTIEIDILLTNSAIIIPVEVKTTLNVDAVNAHIHKHLIPFKGFFPEYIDKKIYGAVAYIHVEEDADRYAYKKGLYVLTFGDNDLVVIKNDPQFKPTVW